MPVMEMSTDSTGLGARQAEVLIAMAAVMKKLVIIGRLLLELGQALRDFSQTAIRFVVPLDELDGDGLKRAETLAKIVESEVDQANHEPAGSDRRRRGKSVIRKKLAKVHICLEIRFSNLLS